MTQVVTQSYSDFLRFYDLHPWKSTPRFNYNQWFDFTIHGKYE